MDLPMRSPARKLRAYALYLRKPLRNFLPTLLGLLVIILLGGLAFHRLCVEEHLSYSRAVQVTYCLVLNEHILASVPEHWLLQVLYYVLPLVGLLVFLEAIVRFGVHTLRLDAASKEWACAMAQTLEDHVILAGLGKVGLRVLQQLLQLGEHVIVLEKNADNHNLAFARNHGVPVLIGTGREEGIFNELNTAKAKSFIIATDDDLANLEMAMDARKANPKIRVVLRMYDQELASKVRESLGIELAFSTAALAAPLFATASADHSIVNAFYADDQLLVVARVKVASESGLSGKPVRDIGRQYRMIIVSLKRDGQTSIFPKGDTALKAGDELTVETTPDLIKEIHRLNKRQQPG